ncbi:MAG: hypothetical protein ABSG67_06610, partial [Thermoguttaceae bacterium]
MTIERDDKIRFHELGTLLSVSRWVNNHDDGIAEWLKNVRRAYQADRANVLDEHRSALILMKDGDIESPAILGVLDVGGATLNDVNAWSTWQDPTASGRGAEINEEQTQGNGGKAYMYRMFTGRTRILGIQDGKLNCKGFEGPENTIERGTPGFIPDVTSAKDLPISSWESQLKKALEPYNIRLEELPAELKNAIYTRKSFTLVEGIDPTNLYKKRIPENLVPKLLRCAQSTAVI